eukprot:TRINITY_DN11873_c0_g3_i1.p4 TRINITY_DN11873_c0_g3~~TRINITY_DN11873_c0_g3_i1.p4  ORF type:complete len:112 (+),score=13.99 TRINITY_DN11873_c0_g3_i1:3217-3552(+)
MSLYSHFKSEQPGAARKELVKGKVQTRRPSSSSSFKATPVVSRDVQFENDLELLRQFDLDLKLGPCVGISRMERWQRAQNFGLGPSPKIKELLDNHLGDERYQQCLWHDAL